MLCSCDTQSDTWDTQQVCAITFYIYWTRSVVLHILILHVTIYNPLWYYIAAEYWYCVIQKFNPLNGLEIININPVLYCVRGRCTGEFLPRSRPSRQVLGMWDVREEAEISRMRGKSRQGQLVFLKSTGRWHFNVFSLASCMVVCVST